MVTLEFFDPSGALEKAKPHAPRLDTLAGKRIGFVSNGQWQAFRMLPLVREILEQDHPGVEVLPIDRFPQGNTLIGNAARIEAPGIPTVTITRKDFVGVVKNAMSGLNVAPDVAMVSWLQGNSPALIGRQVRVPETFDALIDEAQQALGGG